MVGSGRIVIVSLLGLLTTSSSIFGAALGLYVPLSKRMLAGVLAFAAGALISALAIELAFEGARTASAGFWCKCGPEEVERIRERLRP